jgi:putative ABC transport system permease protein
MNALGFAWRSLVRQPARATLGVLGVAAVGALLLDMLLLSNGLVLSMGDLLDRVGFDVRVTASDALPGSGPRLRDVSALTARIVALPSVRSAATLLFGDTVIEAVPGAQGQVRVGIQGAGGTAPHPWTILRGDDTRGPRELALNENAARLLAVRPGASIAVRASCSGDPDTRPPVSFRVTGMAEFPFDSPNDRTAGTDLSTLADVCGTEYADAADVIMVTSREGAGGAAQAAAAIAALDPDLRALTNEQALGRMQQRGVSYFRQISTVLSTVTLSFALLLITVLLTVSVNQRLGEIAALRALGFSRRRIVADVLCESSLIVGAGGLLSLPLGVLLAAGLDRILKNMPGVPAPLHFFVFEGWALALHATLLVATAILAALYPMRIVARLPIAATLRDEVIS